jgi:hypothetical protein
MKFEFGNPRPVRRYWTDGLRLRVHQGSGRDIRYLAGREDSSAAQAEDAKFEYSRGFIIDPTVDAESGQLEEAEAVPPKGRNAGATWRIGQSATSRDPRFRATWKLVNRRSRKRRCGATWKFSEGTTGWCANRGNSGIHQPVPEDP